MTQRKYSLDEIDTMRKHIEMREENKSQMGQRYIHSHEQFKNEIEELLRTYMMANISPSEVEQSYLESEKAYDEYLDVTEKVSA